MLRSALAALLLLLASPALAVDPNILVIVSDDQGLDTVSAYTDKVIAGYSTPNIDRIASAGMRFNRAYANDALCQPARASMLTGLHPSTHKVFGSNDSLDISITTVADILKAAGYETAMIGKHHLAGTSSGFTPAQLGFDYYNVFPALPPAGTSLGAYEDPDLDENGVVTTHTGGACLSGNTGHAGTCHVTDELTVIATDWLDDWQAAATGEPFFLWVGHKAPHLPAIPALRDEGQHTAAVAEPSSFNDARLQRTAIVRDNTFFLLFPGLYNIWTAAPYTTTYHKDQTGSGGTDAENKSWVYQRLMGDTLRTGDSLDDSVGTLLDYLDTEGLAANTVVIYISDNGFMNGRNSLYEKRTIYDYSARIPLLISGPGIATGVDNHMVSNVSIAPTLVALAGEAIPANMEARSLTELTDGSPAGDWPTSVYYHHFDGASTFPNLGVITERWKYIRHYVTVSGLIERELIDVFSDPDEIHNLLPNPTYDKTVDELDALLRAHLSTAGLSGWCDARLCARGSFTGTVK